MVNLRRQPPSEPAPQTPAPTCGTCAHWQRPEVREGWKTAVRIETPNRHPSHSPNLKAEQAAMERDEALTAAADQLYGICQKVVLSDPYDPFAPGDPLPIALTKDASDYTADLYTQAEFGCVLHTPPETGDPA
jgi:hypothetical protein